MRNIITGNFSKIMFGSESSRNKQDKLSLITFYEKDGHSREEY